MVLCSGWLEWSSVAGEDKQKYLLDNVDSSPLYMRDIFYTILEAPTELVTLTVKPTDLCSRYHHRIPLLTPEKAVEDWLRLPIQELYGLFTGV